MNVQDVGKLRRNQGLFRSRINWVIKRIEHLLEDAADKCAVEKESNRLESYWVRCRDAQEQIECLLDDDGKVDEEIRNWMAFESTVVDLKAKVKKYLQRDRIPEAQGTSDFTVTGPNLPRWTLPRYSGDVLQFASFWDQFVAAVHSRSDLSDVTKMVYLKSALTGDALEAIQGLSVTNANYTIAVDVLRQRFGREDAVVEAHVLSLLRMEKPDQRTPGTMRKLYDQMNGHVRALSAIGKDIGRKELSAEEILLVVFKQCLPNPVRKRWEQKVLMDEQVKENPMESFFQFMRVEVETEDCLSNASQPVKSRTNSRNYDRKQNDCIGKKAHGSTEPTAERRCTAAALHAAVHNGSQCAVCGEGHTPRQCPTFGRASVKQRWELCRKAGLCIRCLCAGHIAKNCESEERCNRSGCNRDHNERLHREEDVEDVKVCLQQNERQSIVLLQTAQAKIYCQNGAGCIVTCLFDAGAQCSFIRESLATALGLSGPTEYVSIHSFGNEVARPTKCRRVRFSLGALRSGHCQPMEALCIRKMCTVLGPNQQIQSSWSHIQGLGLADKFPRGGTTVDILIGLDYYYHFVTGEMRRGRDDQPVAVQTTLGWIVCGRSEEPASGGTQILHVTVEKSLEPELKKLWQLDAIGIGDDAELENDRHALLEAFKDTLSFDGTRYTVRLPWKAERSLPNNYQQAYRRLSHLEKRLQDRRSDAAGYDAAIQEYMDNGWAEEAKQSAAIGKEWYLPHHAVIRHDKSTTKCRIVFDASARHQGMSLNDLLDAGPPLQTDLVGVLLRFRQFKVAVQADIEKMFMQIRLHQDERDYVRFLWRRFDSCVEPTIWRFTRVCFGLKSSPFLALAVVSKHADDFAHQFSRGASEVKRNMYVDDLVSSYRTKKEAVSTSEEARQLLKMGGFELRKWTSNCPEVLEHFTETCFENCDNATKTLGLIWHMRQDMLSLAHSCRNGKLESTKRSLLKCAAEIFDPLGFIAPFTVVAKMLLQTLWKQKSTWDAEMPRDVESKWLRWSEEVTRIKELQVPRWIGAGSQVGTDQIELHVYCDASGTAYGAAAYLRLGESCGTASVQLVMSKSRIAPVKELTIPRLELLAALIGARLGHFVTQQLSLSISRSVYWTDSLVALAWIRSAAGQWKQFIRNRIAEIQTLTDPLAWRHCPSKENPADLISRGCRLETLRRSDLRWHGPNWLRAAEDAWPSQNLAVTPEPDNAELRKLVTVNVVQDKRDFGRLDPSRYAQFDTLIRLTALCLRFVHNTRQRTGNKSHGDLSVSELEDAERLWFSNAQQSSYGSELQRLRAGRPLRSDSRIRAFDPFIGKDGLLRIGGRMRKAELPWGARHQIILPHEHHVVSLLIKHYHERTFHAPTETTLAALQQKFWITRGRATVKRVIKDCRICRRVYSAPFQPKMSDLPKERVTMAQPFQRIGVDFAGPLAVRRGKGHGRVYICLFTCLVVRAVHLELVRNLTTDDFLLALNRFMARRGKPSYIVSDNFRSFQAADKELSDLFSKKNKAVLQRDLSKNRIVWKFITPRAPWTGGCWERLVGSVKTALKKVLGQAYLDEQQLSTMLCNIEAQINSRPLTFISTDPADMECLTPFHFLNGRAFHQDAGNTDMGETPLPLTGHGLRKRWQAQQRALAHFWKRWKREYLIALSGRKKWTVTRSEPHVGDVVLVEEDNVRRQNWKLGRIEECQYGDIMHHHAIVCSSHCY